MVMMQKAMKGNVRAFEQIARLTSIDTKDSLDKKEQRERIKKLKLDNDRHEQLLAGEDTTEEALASYFRKLDEVLDESD